MNPVTISGAAVFEFIDAHGLPLEVMMNGEAVWSWEEFIRAALRNWAPKRIAKCVETACEFLSGSKEYKSLFLRCFRQTMVNVMKGL